ncbi:MAG: hypothetical protein L7H21_01115 [Sulfolobales archaeon]|nr:hypothetical protein [Sulfolobales archaeon]MCG2893260.1 hypothetical protein [Sulfolobales archaeon]MCG2910239.1 hypothetical protein [Sulfolobales archaeon]
MAEYEIKSFGDLIKALFKYGNWYLGGFVILLILFVLMDIALFTPHT